jgi:hypothetical protein
VDEFRGRARPPPLSALSAAETEGFGQRYFPHLDHALQPLVDAGFKLIWHSDGNMNDMIGPLIDIGRAGFQGFQEECGTLIKDVAKRREYIEKHALEVRNLDV